MKKIGIITFCNYMNYGAELQAYALQRKLNMMGADAEVLHIETEGKVILSSIRAIKGAFFKRYKQYGLVKGSYESIKLIKDKIDSQQAFKKNKSKHEEKKEIFDSFFRDYIRHSDHYYTLEELRAGHITSEYDVLVAGSDQIWNCLQTHYLDVFFLMFAKGMDIRKVSYAASFSIDSIPTSLISTYKNYLENLDEISVREDIGVKLVQQISKQDVTQVLDPTFLLTFEEWKSLIAIPDYVKSERRYVILYTLSGSRYIYNLARHIGNVLNAEVLNLKYGYTKVKGDEGIIHLYDVGPREFISLFSQALYVITDSFHGTAFSINFNIPFSTLLNPVSGLNSRVLSLLRLTNTMDRMLYDDGQDKVPTHLEMDFNPINKIINVWKNKSIDYIERCILS